MLKRYTSDVRFALTSLFALACTTLALAACSGGGGITATTPTPVPTVSSIVGSGALYVVNSGTSGVTIFQPSPGPTTTPFTTISGPNTRLARPQYIFFDQKRNAYISNNDPVNGPNVLVFPTGTTGNTAPSTIIAGSNTLFANIGSVIVDGYQRIYVANYSTGANPQSQILVFNQGASGNVAPATQVSGSLTQLSQPVGIYFDNNGLLYVANATPSVTVYPAFTFGNIPPSSVIAGANTQMVRPTGVMVDGSGRIYVSDAVANQILVFAPNASGNVAPIRTLFGPATGLNSPSGMALDQIGDLYVANAGTITVYAPLASGNTAPMTTLTQSQNINAPIGIAISF